VSHPLRARAHQQKNQDADEEKLQPKASFALSRCHCHRINLPYCEWQVPNLHGAFPPRVPHAQNQSHPPCDGDIANGLPTDFGRAHP
jgi:hypothetical protein